MIVIGIGNLLMTDDGVGIQIVRALEESAEFDDVPVVDAKTKTATILEAMDGHEKAIIVDAMSMEGAEAGDVHSFSFDPEREGPPPDVSLTVHDRHFTAALQTGADAYDLPEEIVVLGVEPDEIAVGMGLSDACERSIPAVIQRLREETGRA